MDAGMQDLVDKKHLAGIVTLVARHGKVVQHKAYGVQSLETGAPMKTDTIARIYSMTKPIAGVAMMMLYEEGKWKPSDPIAKHIPEFANLKVYAGEKDGQPILEAPAHPPTMGELMSHSAGFTYGLFGNTPVDMIYRREQSAGGAVAAGDDRSAVDDAAALSARHAVGLQRVGRHPGLPGREALGQDVPGVPAHAALRTARHGRHRVLRARRKTVARGDDLCVRQGEGRTRAGEPRDPAISQLPGLPSGGGGLYWHGRRLFPLRADAAERRRVRTASGILKKATVDMMRTNVLSEQVLNSKSGIGQAQFSPAQGFGYDFAVVLDPDAAKRQVGKNSYWWWGIAGTWFWIDPTNDLICIGIIQRRGGVPGAANHEDMSRQGDRRSAGASRP